MKKILVCMLVIVMMLLATASAESMNWVNCEELGILISVPESCTTKYSSSDKGLYVYAGEEGAIPYVLIVPRTEDLRFKDPDEYLNKGYKAYMEQKYGAGQTDMSPVQTYEFGGKKLLGAKYGYSVNSHSLEQLKLIEIGTDRDIEYTVKYLKGEDKAVLSVMDAVAGSLETDSGDRLMPTQSASALAIASVKGTQNGETTDPLPGAQKSDTTVPAAGTILLPDEIAPADTQNGVYSAEVTDLEKIANGGFFTVRLYQDVTYPKEKVEALQAGDRVEVNGTVYTVESMVKHESNVLELMPEEEIFGYIVFVGKDNRYTLLVDDETVRTHLTDVKIWMPLANNFSFAWIEGNDDATVYDADGFVRLVNQEEIPDLEVGHTTVQFEDGLLMTVLYTEFAQ